MSKNRNIGMKIDYVAGYIKQHSNQTTQEGKHKSLMLLMDLPILSKKHRNLNLLKILRNISYSNCSLLTVFRHINIVNSNKDLFILINYVIFQIKWQKITIHMINVSQKYLFKEINLRQILKMILTDWPPVHHSSQKEVHK